MTARELLTRAADRLDTLTAAATPGPWAVTEKSARWGGIVSVNSPVATDSEIDGYGGELVGESMSQENRSLVIALRPMAAELAAFFRRQAETVQPDAFAIRWASLVLGEPACTDWQPAEGSTP